MTRKKLILGMVCVLAGLSPLATHAKTASDLTGSAQTYIVQKGDSLSTVARRFDIGAVELEAANPQIAWPRLSADEVLNLPLLRILPRTTPSAIVINLAELRLYYFAPDGHVDTFPVSVGRRGWETPVGDTAVVLKRKDPSWVVPASIHAEDPKLPAVVPPGVKNPMGQYALNLGWPGYAIHGTNAPSSIGKPVSHGCIRMYPEDIARLFGEVEVGTSVTVMDQRILIGRGDNGHLYLQVLPDREQARRLANHQPPTSGDTSDADSLALPAALAAVILEGDRIDMTVVNDAMARHDGLPVDITMP